MSLRNPLSHARSDQEVFEMMVRTLCTPAVFSIVLGLVLGLLLSPGLGGGGAARAQETPSISADAVIESRSGGFKFPDGTIQQTAAAGKEQVGAVVDSARSLSVYQGLYDNRIREFTHSVAFVEICFKDGAVLSDQNDSGASTAGGDCVPGDVGWIFEADNRPDTDWTSAKATCLQFGMRLPEIFELHFVCPDAQTFGLSATLDRPEWMSNTPEIYGGVVHVQSGRLRNCDAFGLGSVGDPDGEDFVLISTWSYRCAL